MQISPPVLDSEENDKWQVNHQYLGVNKKVSQEIAKDQYIFSPIQLHLLGFSSALWSSTSMVLNLVPLNPQGNLKYTSV